MSARLAGWLGEPGCPKHGARVATWAAKAELTCLMPLAAARAGLVHVPINPLLKRAQVAHILADSGAGLLLATPARLASLEAGDVPQGCALLAEGDALGAGCGPQSDFWLPPPPPTLMTLPRFSTPAVPPGGPRG